MTASTSRPLTIGFLRRGYSSSGGVEVYLKGLAGGLNAAGHRVILLGTAEWPSVAWPGGEILRCSGKSLSSYASAVEHHKEESGIQFDLILSVEKVPGCDIYRTDEGLHLKWLTERQKYISPWARWFQWRNPKHREKISLEKQLFRTESTRRIISISDKITRDIVACYNYPVERISLVRNGVPQVGIPSLNQRNEARRALGVSVGEKIILFVGTGWERKGLGFAIQAVESLADIHPGIRLLVAGKGAQKRYASPVVKFLGPVQQMALVYAAADIFITPTIYEPFSLAALEAFSAGLPVITSAAAGISEIMTAGVHGEVIAEPSDVRALAVALEKWIHITDDPERVSKSRSDCSALASGFTLKRNLQETLSVINEVIEEKSAVR